MVAPGQCADRVAGLGQGCHFGQRGDQQPAKPDAGSGAAGPHAVHTVVPVASADQRHAVHSGEGCGLVKATGTVVKQGGAFV